MLKVRRTMTEILLSVTTREIQQICKEELQRYISKTKGIVISHCGVKHFHYNPFKRIKQTLVSFHLCETVIA